MAACDGGEWWPCVTVEYEDKMWLRKMLVVYDSTIIISKKCELFCKYLKK